MYVRNPGPDLVIWQETAFKAMAIVILVDGILELITGIVGMTSSKGAAGGSLIGHGAIMVAVGAGLLLEYDWASLIVKIICWINLVVAGGIIIGSLMLMGASILAGVALLLVALIFGGIYGFMLYLVNTVGLD